jgi:ABC-type branched-subunit amino acid transport system ATPase component
MIGEENGVNAGDAAPPPEGAAPGPGPSVLSLRDVRVAYGGLNVLNGVSFDVASNSIKGLVGRNGAGKTTILNCVSGLIRPYGGSVAMRGAPLRGLAPHSIAKLGVSRTFQSPEVFRDMRVIDTVMLGRTHRLPRSAAIYTLGLPWIRGHEKREREICIAALDYVGYNGKLGAEVGSLPFGTAKLVDLARAVAADPVVLLLDEPASGLANSERRVVERIVCQLRDDRNMTQVLIEHDLDLVRGVSDEVAILDSGGVLADGPAEATLDEPAVRFALLGITTTDPAGNADA